MVSVTFQSFLIRIVQSRGVTIGYFVQVSLVSAFFHNQRVSENAVLKSCTVWRIVLLLKIIRLILALLFE
jgi:hypothetical protein